MSTRRTSRREEILEHHGHRIPRGRKPLYVQGLAILLGWILGAVAKQGSVDPTWEGRGGAGVGGTSSGAAPGDGLSSRSTLPPQVWSAVSVTVPLDAGE